VYLVKNTFDYCILQKFSHFLRTEVIDQSNLVRSLDKVEAYLRENSSRFMISDNLSRADCYLLPTLQHIRVAGKVRMSFIL